ncbi:MAG: acyltransferase family protein [Flavobacteriaceae bacterium]
MESLKSKRIFGLDLLRTLAITLVVLSHTTYLLYPHSNNTIVTLIRLLGAIGVDLFFVLSGYLIGGILLKVILNNKCHFSDLLLFWKRRWLRTVPNYMLILVCNIILCLSFNQELPSNIVSYVVFLQNFTTSHPDFFTEAWSLSIEEYAYIFLPLALYLSFVLLKSVDKKRLFFLVTLLSIIVLFGVKINYYINTDVASYKEWSSGFRKIVVYRLDAIYMGFLLVYMVKCKRCFFDNYKKLLAVLALCVFTGIHAVIYCCNLLPQTHLYFYTFIYLSTVSLCIAMMIPYVSSINYSGFGKPLIEYISKISYSIYLVNYSIVLLSIKHFIDVDTLDLPYRIITVMVFLMLTLLLSVVIYTFYERPILKFRDQKYKM